MINYYEILGILPFATPSEIQEALSNAFVHCSKQKKSPLREAKIEELERIKEVLEDEEEKENYDRELEEWLAEEKRRKEEQVNFSEYLLESTDHWGDLIPPSIVDPVEKVSHLFDLIIDLPSPEITRPLMLACMLTPSAMSSCLPVVFCWGKTGVGKSQPPKFNAALWGNTMLLSQSTYPSIRNQIQFDRWSEPTTSRGEQNYILAWDDVNYEKLSELYTLLKGGYSRSSSTITIAGKDGENFTFNVFGGRILSSITPFFGDSRLSELRRRMIIFPMVRSLRSITDFDEISWVGLNSLTAEIWGSKDNCARFVQSKKLLKAAMRGGSTLSIDRQNLFTDVLATGISLGLFPDVTTAIKTIEIHEERMSKLTTKELDGLTQILTIFIEDQKIESIERGVKFRIRPDKLKMLILEKVKGGELDGFPRRGEISANMRQLGFSLNVNLGAWEPCED